MQIVHECLIQDDMVVDTEQMTLSSQGFTRCIHWSKSISGVRLMSNESEMSHIYFLYVSLFQVWRKGAKEEYYYAMMVSTWEAHLRGHPAGERTTEGGTSSTRLSKWVMTKTYWWCLRPRRIHVHKCFSRAWVHLDLESFVKLGAHMDTEMEPIVPNIRNADNSPGHGIGGGYIKL